MSVETSDPASGAIETYRERVRRPRDAEVHRALGYDELVGADGVHSEDQALARAIEQMGTAGLRARAAQAQRFVRSDGITYGSTEEGRQARNWRIDPLPVIVTSNEWDTLEHGLHQRARLLDAVLRDAYGTRTLLRRGVIPPEVILGNPGFIRQSDGIRLPTEQQLIIAACDVARSADGGWQAFGDRAQAPSGAGYAMATRRIVARTLPAVHRDTSTSRLRGFFHTMRSTLLSTAHRGDQHQAPRVVVLSSGDSTTAFDQAFLATLLGFPLVEGDDLAMRDGRVWLRSPSEMQPVDVVLRRVDAEWADPLELRSGSQLGVPGLIDAARRRQVSIVNPMGAGILESPALVHFLPQVAREVLGEDLTLAQPESWWCGDDAQRSHVLTNLRRLVVKPAVQTPETTTRLGWTLSDAEASELAAQIKAQPWSWSAQEPLPESTAPVVTTGGIEPRRLVLRTFGVADGDGYTFMPGALGRVAAEVDQDVVSNREGSLAKDVWVLIDRDHTGPAWSSDRELTPAPAAVGAPAPRIADDLYWVGRYTERVEFTARLLKVADDLTEDFGSRPGSLGAIAMNSVQHAVTMVTAVAPQQMTEDGLDFQAPDRWQTGPGEHILSLVNGRQPGSLGFTVSRLVRAAQRVRDQLSVDTWPVLSRLENTVSEADQHTSLQDVLEAVLESALALEGIWQQSMIRDMTWAYVDAGGRVERALLTTELLRSTLAIERSPVIEGQIVEAVLQVGESVITHRRRTAAGLGPSVPVQSALHLLAMDATNPRSLVFQLDRLEEDLKMLGDDAGAQWCRDLAEPLRGLDLEALGDQQRIGLQELLIDVRERVVEFTTGMNTRHFRRQGTRGTQQTEWTFGEARQ